MARYDMLGMTLRRIIGNTSMDQELAYAGDLSPWQAWDRLADDPVSRLIDVRTQPEWQFVGRPDLRQHGKEPVLLAWQLYPDMRPNPDFIADLERLGIGRDEPLLLLCRSGQRSRAAAAALTAAGFTAAFNIVDGFEGPRDEANHRGTSVGWKALDLPWVQD